MEHYNDMNRKNVVIRAPLLSQSGYGVHSRQIAKFLFSRQDFTVTSQVVNWGNTPWLLNHEYEDGLVGKILETSTTNIKDFDISFQVQLPNEWDTTLANFNVGVTALVETDKCNPRWIEKINKMDLVIVPSQFVKKTIYNTGVDVTTKVIVVGESYHESIDKEINDIKLDVDTKFNFLVFGQFTGSTPQTDRKNLFNTIKWLCEEFKDDKNVGIVFKTNSSRGTKIDKGITVNLVNRLIGEVRKGKYPKIHLLHGNMTPEEVAALYKHKNINALVSASRGEGFGLPLLEAASSALPIIATNWSGHLDFLNLGSFIKLDYELKEIDKRKIDNNIFVPGLKWAEVNEQEFKKKVKTFYKNRKGIQSKSNKLAEKIKKKYSSDAISEQYNNLIQKNILQND
jgi:glycosyltransferase involved in cell wall biosynthesis